MYLSRNVVEIVFNGRWICIYSTVDTIVCISINNEAWTWRNQTCTTHLRTARGHMTRRRRPQKFGKTLILKHICQKTRIRCFVAVCLAAPRSFVSLFTTVVVPAKVIPRLTLPRLRPSHQDSSSPSVASGFTPVVSSFPPIVPPPTIRP